MRYGEDLWKVIFWVIWYPVVYWAFNAMAAAVSFLKGFFRSMQQPATWVSPDRGGSMMKQQKPVIDCSEKRSRIIRWAEQLISAIATLIL